MTRDTGTFECLDCQCSTEYRLRAKRNFITVYFIPIVPLNWEAGDEEVQCVMCKSKFPAGILDGSWPMEHPDSLKDSFDFMIRRFALIPMLVSDGSVQTNQKRNSYAGFAGKATAATWIWNNWTLKSNTFKHMGSTTPCRILPSSETRWTTHKKSK